MADLITRARALRYLAGLTSPSALENTLIDSLILACSQAIERYCGRQFHPREYDEVVDGLGQRELLLRNYPVLAVERIAYGPVGVLTIINTDPDTYQRARVQVTDDGLTLTRVASGVTSKDELTFADYPTLSDLKSAINLLAHGWAATIPESKYTYFPSEDLRALQGAFNARNLEVALFAHGEELSDFRILSRKGILLRGRSASRASLTCPGNIWAGGANYWRIQYTAGFYPLPAEVEQACAEWVAQLFWTAQRDPGLTQEQVIGTIFRVPLQGMTQTVRQLLAPFRTWSLASRGN